MSLAALSRWCYRRRRMVVALWVVAFVVLNTFGGVIGDAYSDNFSGGKSDSIQAFDLLKERFPARAGDTADIVFTADQGVNDPQVRAAMESLFAEVGPGKVPHVVALDSPYQVPGRISHDGKIAYATVTFDQQAGDMPADTAQPLIDAAKRVDVPGLRVELSGPVVARAPPAAHGFHRGGRPAGRDRDPVHRVRLAAGDDLADRRRDRRRRHRAGVRHAAQSLHHRPVVRAVRRAMIGLGVGIDYALFIVVRYRTGLHDGLDPENANVLALTTAGRAVLFAGCTVIISLLGMFIMGIDFIYGLSIGAVLAVLMTMLASVTLVPAIMGFAGTKLAAKDTEAEAPSRDRGVPLEPPDPEAARVRWRSSASILLVLAHSDVLDPARRRRPGQRPDVAHDPPGLRPAGEGLRPGVQRADPARVDLAGSTTADSVDQFADAFAPTPTSRSSRPCRSTQPATPRSSL